MMKSLRTRRIQSSLAALLVIIVLIAGVWYGKNFVFDKRTKKHSDVEQVQKKIQEDADKSQFQIRINSRIELDTPDSEAALYIRNPEANQYDTYVELISDASGETAYTSDTLKPGDSALTGKLKGVTGTGEQAYTAYFHIMEKGNEISSIEYGVIVVVKES